MMVGIYPQNLLSVHWNQGQPGKPFRVFFNILLVNIPARFYTKLIARLTPLCEHVTIKCLLLYRHPPADGIEKVGMQIAWYRKCFNLSTSPILPYNLHCPMKIDKLLSFCCSQEYFAPLVSLFHFFTLSLFFFQKPITKHPPSPGLCYEFCLQYWYWENRILTRLN